MKLCEKCNKINVDEATHCKYCGESLEAEIPEGFKVITDLDDDTPENLALADVVKESRSIRSDIKKFSADTMHVEPKEKKEDDSSLKEFVEEKISSPAPKKPIEKRTSTVGSEPVSLSKLHDEPKEPYESERIENYVEDVHSNITVRPMLTGGSIWYKQKIDAYDGFEKIKCPKCGSDNLSFVSNSLKKGFSAGNACCGAMLLGPLGILCGAFGANKTETSEYWVCGSCGNKFQSSSGSAEKEKIKRQAALLAGTPDDTISNIDTILSQSTTELEKIKDIYKNTAKEEYFSNGKLKLFAIISAALVVLLIVLSLLLHLVFDVGAVPVVITALIAIVIAVVAFLARTKIESKFASAKYLQAQADYREAVQINNQLKAIKEAKDNLSRLRII